MAQCLTDPIDLTIGQLAPPHIRTSNIYEVNLQLHFDLDDFRFVDIVVDGFCSPHVVLYKCIHECNIPSREVDGQAS